VLAGASLARRSTDATLATAASAAIFNHWIGHEEANLTELFGDAYRHYRNHTSRWFGAPARA
jgi:protein-S-isoprenylcysteine O-methyltransferase Ste14